MVSRIFNIEAIRQAVKENRIVWRKHVLERMMQRGIKRAQICEAIVNGECIREYFDDKPFPSGLFLAYFDNEPLHVVAGIDGCEVEA